jgi:2-oxoglutarate dehydrogenase E1 component
MQVVVPSNAAQMYHLLRRQMIRLFRKPLIIMTPKSLLRNKEAMSPLAEFAKGQFHTVIGEVEHIDPDSVKRVVCCSGKVYYDLVAERRERDIKGTAIIRIEQSIPPHKTFVAEMKRYPNATQVVWCQEEPQNQGAWYQTRHYFVENMREDQKLLYAGRPSSASPAVGYYAKHQEQQKALVAAFSKFKAPRIEAAEFCGRFL